MKASSIAILLLVVALFGTNIWWAFRMFDAGISYTYQGASLEQNEQALAQSLAIINTLGSSNSSRSQVIKAAQEAWPSTEPFEKEGYLWVGRLGLRFNAAGQLVEAVDGY